MTRGSREARVVDTNVVVIASNRDEPSPECVLACSAALQRLMSRGLLVIDDGWEILREYLRNVSPRGQPGVGESFVKWALSNQANPARVRAVTIAPAAGTSSYAELPPEAESIDPADKKFVAVAAAHPDRPPILQALDSKWWAWRDTLAKAGIEIEFLCPRDIQAKHDAKLGSR